MTKLEAQVMVAPSAPEPGKLHPVTDRMHFKPVGGMWTSTLDDQGGQWLRWLTGEGYTLDMPRWGGKLWRLDPADANLFVCANPDDLRELASRFRHPEAKDDLVFLRRMIDWKAVSEEYDGVHFPDPWSHRWATGDDYEAGMIFYTLDAESTCWFRWCFEGEPVELDPQPFLGKLNEEAA